MCTIASLQAFKKFSFIHKIPRPQRYPDNSGSVYLSQITLKYKISWDLPGLLRDFINVHYHSLIPPTPSLKSLQGWLCPRHSPRYGGSLHSDYNLTLPVMTCLTHPSHLQPWDFLTLFIEEKLCTKLMINLSICFSFFKFKQTFSWVKVKIKIDFYIVYLWLIFIYLT